MLTGITLQLCTSVFLNVLDSNHKIPKVKDKIDWVLSVLPVHGAEVLFNAYQCDYVSLDKSS